MVYECLSASETKNKIRMRDWEHHVTLVDPSVAGIHILATCRLINEEASSILKARLSTIRQRPPKIVVEAEHLIGLIRIHDCCRSDPSLLGRIARAMRKGSRCTKAIDRYRTGKASIEVLRAKLDLNDLIKKEDHKAIKAVASFLMHAVEYARSKPRTTFRHPPITVVIEVPQGFQTLNVVTTTSRAMSLIYRFTSRVRRPRTCLGQARLSWLVRRWAFDIALESWLWESVSFNITLRYLLADGQSYPTVPQVIEHRFRTAVMLGANDAGFMGKGLVEYGGVAPEELDENNSGQLRRRAWTL